MKDAAIVSVAQSIHLGDADFGLAGGAESMSRGPHIVPAARFGQKMGDTKIIDMMIGALHDPFQNIHMGVTAENIAKKFQKKPQFHDAGIISTIPIGPFTAL